MVKGFLIFGKAADAFIKLVLALCIIEHFTGVFKKVFGGWVFDPLFADKDELFRAIEIAGYIGIMLAGTFPICYLFQRYCRKPMHFIGRKLGLSDTGARALLWCWPISSRFITCSKACGRAIRCCASPSASVRKPHWAITGVYRQLPTFAGAADHDGQIPRRHDCRANRHQDPVPEAELLEKNRRKGSRRPSPPPLAEFSLSHKINGRRLTGSCALFAPDINY